MRRKPSLMKVSIWSGVRDPDAGMCIASPVSGARKARFCRGPAWRGLNEAPADYCRQLVPGRWLSGARRQGLQVDGGETNHHDGSLVACYLCSYNRSRVQSRNLAAIAFLVPGPGSANDVIELGVVRLPA